MGLATIDPHSLWLCGPIVANPIIYRWLCGSIFANPIIYRLVPRPPPYEIRQYKNEVCTQFHFHANQSLFRMNGFALTLALKQRCKGAWKWPIVSLVALFDYLAQSVRNCDPKWREKFVGAVRRTLHIWRVLRVNSIRMNLQHTKSIHRWPWPWSSARLLRLINLGVLRKLFKVRIENKILYWHNLSHWSQWFTTQAFQKLNTTE